MPNTAFPQHTSLQKTIEVKANRKHHCTLVVKETGQARFKMWENIERHGSVSYAVYRSDEVYSMDRFKIFGMSRFLCSFLD